MNENVSIQFIKGENERAQPEIRLFRNPDGKKGKAVYKFYKPTTITLSNHNSIQKMYLIDSEGELSTKKTQTAKQTYEAAKKNKPYVFLAVFVFIFFC